MNPGHPLRTRPGHRHQKTLSDAVHNKRRAGAASSRGAARLGSTPVSRYGSIILAALTITALLGWFAAELIASRRPADAIDVLPVTPLDPDALTRMTLTPQCESLKSDIQKQALDSAACQTDADCVALRMDCPFACASAINQQHFVALFELNQRFVADCGRCLAPCTDEPAPVLCRRGRCGFELVPDNLLRSHKPPDTRSVNERPDTSPKGDNP